MPVDPATTNFRLPSIMAAMPRVLRTPNTNITPSSGGGNPPPTTGQLYPRGEKT